MTITLLFIVVPIALIFGLLALLWLFRAVVGLVVGILSAPFNRAARADLVALRFLRHSFFPPPRPPTDRMASLARTVAREKNVPLTDKTLRSFSLTRRFLNTYSRDIL